MKDYLNMDYIKEVNEFEQPDKNYYIPHHSIFLTESNSISLRVMFIASSLTSSENH